jgi:hypothetical protein
MLACYYSGGRKWLKKVLFHLIIHVGNNHKLHSKKKRKASYKSCYMRWLLKMYSVTLGKIFRNVPVLPHADLLEEIISHTELWQHESGITSSANLQSVCRQWQATNKENCTNLTTLKTAPN